MKKTGSRRFKAIGIVLLALTIVCSVIALSACNTGKAVTEIAIDESSVDGYYVVGEFDITSIRLNVTYEDESVAPIAATKSMLSTEAVNSLKEPGQKSITINYKGKQAILEIYLVADGSEIACVTFNTYTGNEIAKRFTVPGGSVTEPEHPEVEGQRFLGWVNDKGEKVDLTKVEGSMTVTASYSVISSEYSYTFIDHNGKVLKSGTKKGGEKITSNDVPSVDFSKYPEITRNIGWSESFPYTVNENVSIKLIPEYKVCSVLFAFEKESAPTAYTYNQSCAVNVRYGGNVNDSKDRMEKYLREQGFEIVSYRRTDSGSGTEIKTEGMVEFIYTVRDASVSVKVFADDGKHKQLSYDSPVRIGTSVKLPTASDADPKSGYALSAWKITGEKGAVTVSLIEGSWTVDNSIGLSVEITPVYSPLTVNVDFIFDFKDRKLAEDDSKNYLLTVSVGDTFALGDSVTYKYIDDLLKIITENKSDYLKLLDGQTVTNSAVIGTVKENSSSARITAFNEIDVYGITSVTVGIDKLDLGGAKTVVSSGMEFKIAISAATSGLIWETVKDNENNDIGYAITGVNGSVTDNIFIPDVYSEDGNPSLPVIKIGDGALQGKSVTKVSANLKEIGANAFKNATLYGDLVFANVETMGANAFEGATFSASSVSFEKLGKVSSSAFLNAVMNDTAVSFGESTTEIGTLAFDGAKGVASVTMTDKVTKIGTYAFRNTKIATISDLSGVETVGESAFEGTALSEIALPAAKEIGANAFKNIVELNKITVGGEVAAAARAADGLEFNLDTLTGSVNVTEINLGASVNAAKFSVSGTSFATFFAPFKKLAEINVASGNANLYSDNGVLYSVSGNAYTLTYYPNDKTGSYKAAIPDGASLKVDATAFANSVVAVLDLSDVTVSEIEGTVSGTVYAVCVAEDKTATATTAFGGALIGASAADMEFAYDGDHKLVYKLVTAEDNVSVTVVSGYRYAEQITVPGMLGGWPVTAIASGAFKNFTELESLTVLANLDGWNSEILSGDNALRTLEISGWNGTYKPALADFAGNGWYARHNVIKVGGKLVGYNNTASVNGRPITTVSAEDAAEYFSDDKGIPENFFRGCTNFTSISLPASVKIIGASAFEGCINLENFSAVSLTAVGKNAFKGCTALGEVTLNFEGAAASMSESVFENCTALKTVSLQGKINGTTINGIPYYSLPTRTFFGCSNLVSVDFEYINNFAKSGGASYAFYGCEKLGEFDFTKIIGEEIPANAFENCSSLKYALLGSVNLKTIGQSAFRYCSALKYVQLGANINTLGDSAFEACQGLVVELSYDNGGLYEVDDESQIGDATFAGDVTFFISQRVANPQDIMLFRRYGTTKNSYPLIGFELSNTSKNMSINFVMNDITNKVFLTENDLIAPRFGGYTFAGWYEDADEQTEVSFPVVKKDSVCKIYAKYYDEKQGSVDASTDVKYVYYLGAAPSVDLDSGEQANWYYVKNDGNQVSVSSFPLVVTASRGDEFKIILTVTKGANVVYSKEYADYGDLGYAIVKYSGKNRDRMSIPDTYDDGENGSDEIILMYAGAFKDCISEEFQIPRYVKAILMGDGNRNNDFDVFATDTTFGSELKYVTVSADVEYIADGVFAGSNIEEIVFADNSKLVSVTERAFFGSKWWNTQLESASRNGGFIVAGRCAIKFAGTADVLILGSAETETVTAKTFGFIETDEAFKLNVTIYYNDGGRATYRNMNFKTVESQGDEGVYVFSVKIDNVIDGTFALNSVDTADWTYTAGKNVFRVNSYGSEVIAISIGNADVDVSVPDGIIKLGDGIFRNNTTIQSITMNKELVAIGKETFAGSSLSVIRYGATNNEQYVSAITEVGEDAFAGTPWYRTEKVILGTTFLKYNNVSGSQTLTITENIVRIAPDAFKGATVLSSVTVSSITLKEIGAFAFKNSSISSVTLPRSVEKLGRGVFENCGALVSLRLTDTVITEIPDLAFADCRSLETLSLPNTTIGFGDGALRGCNKLTTITANGITSLSVSGSGNNSTFACGLADTAWYNVSDEAEEDTALTMGKVLVKYVVGTNNIRIFEANNALKVTLPAGITMIAYDALGEDNGSAKYITEIEIPATVTEIGTSAFTGCSNLVTVQIGDNVTEIGDKAFAGLTSLKNAILPECLKKIGDRAFYGTSLTTEVCDDDGIRTSDPGYTIPSTVTEIGNYAFGEVSTLTVINLGANVIKIGVGAFDTVKEGVSNLYKVNWTLGIKGTETTLPDGTIVNESSQIVKLTENLESGAGVFRTESGKAIRFYSSKETVDFIGDVAKFQYATTWTNIYGWRFYENGVLPTVTPAGNGYTLAPFTTEYITKEFMDTKEPLHNTVGGTTYTFMYWVNDDTHEALTYPYVVTADMKIDAVFYTNEIEANAADDNGVVFGTEESEIPGIGYITIITSISNANPGEADKETVYIPNKINGVPVTSFKLTAKNTTVKKLIITNAGNFNGMTQNIFTSFTALESIELKDANSGAVDYKVVPVTLTATASNVTYSAPFYAIYSNDFAETRAFGKKLMALIGNVTVATEYARATQGYTGTEDLDFIFSIPEDVTEIYEGALINTGLKTVGLPSSITTVGDNAFGADLTRLRVAKKINITSVTKNAIPSTAPIMQANGGEQTSTTTYTEINGLKYSYGNGSNFYAFANVLTAYETMILRYNGFVIPNTVNGIDITVIASEIYDGGADKSSELNIDTITLPDKLEKINARAFSKINFKDVHNAASYEKLRDIASNVFDETDYYDKSSALYVGKVLVKWSNYDGADIKPDTIAIASGAFRGSKLSSIRIPDSVVSIGDNAFFGCTNLTSITIPASVTSIGNRAFMQCINLSEVIIDSVNSNLSSIGDNAFMQDKALVNLTLPYNLEKIGDKAFMSCSSLVSVTFDGYVDGVLDPEKTSELTELGASAFSGASKLVTIKIPGNITTIKENTFQECESLVDVEFIANSKLTDIEANAFSDCVALGSMLDKDNPTLLTVQMPDSLVNIGQNAFINCSGMWGISFGHNLASIAEDAFKGCTNLAKVEMNRATAPTITSTTFDLGNPDNNYRLRIYVQSDYTGKIKAAYEDKWQSTWANNIEACGNYIYEANERPKAIFTRTDSTGRTYTLEVEGDVIFSPSYAVGGGEQNAYWQYQEFKQGNKSYTATEVRTGSYRKYGNQKIEVMVDGTTETRYFLVIDYDEITMAISTAADEMD